VSHAAVIDRATVGTRALTQVHVVMQAVRSDVGGTPQRTLMKLDQSRLVWASDRDTFFGNYAPENHNTIPEFRGGRELTRNISKDELFMGWMRPAAHPSAFCQVAAWNVLSMSPLHHMLVHVHAVLQSASIIADAKICCAAVRKFYGQFHQGLKKGDQLQFTVLHQYNTYEFCGEKSLLFTTQSAFGNRNLTFGLVWLVMGVLCGIITVTYIVLGREQLMDPSVRRKNLERWWKMGETPRH
jgi:LEM3 (ligand-effect modulator 3) family / CDC50 family